MQCTLLPCPRLDIVYPTAQPPKATWTGPSLSRGHRSLTTPCSPICTAYMDSQGVEVECLWRALYLSRPSALTLYPKSFITCTETTR